MRKRIILLFIMGFTLVAFLSGCSLFNSTDYVPIVQNGYLGEYTDMTVKDLFLGYYGKDYDEEIWDSGTTDERKEIVEARFSDTSGEKEDAVIQFSMLDEERFEISAFSDPAKPRKDAAERLVVFNTIYVEQYVSVHPELKEDTAAAQAFFERLGKIDGASVKFGASAEYSGDRAKLYEAAGDTPIGLSVVEMLDASDIDIKEYYTDEAVTLVQEGHLGEYTDMTVRELLSGNFGAAIYDEEIWTSHTTDSGAKVVEVTYKSEEDTLEDITVRFTMLNDECFKVTELIDSSYPVEKDTDLTAALNYFYLSAYVQKHSEITGTDDEIKFIKSLERIDGYTVQYGASAEYTGDRRQICKLAGDLPTEGTVVELLDSSGLFDMSYYYQEEPDESEEPEENTDSDKYGSVQEFLDDPSVASLLEEQMAGLDDNMAMDISGIGETLVYTFTFLDYVDTDGIREALIDEMNEPSFVSTFEDIAASLSEAIEVQNPSVIVAYYTWDGVEIYSQEYFAN